MSRGLCAATANGASDRISINARDYIAELIEGGPRRDLSETTRSEFKDFLLSNGHLTTGGRSVFYPDDGSASPELSRSLDALLGSSYTVGDSEHAAWHATRADLSSVLTPSEIDRVFE